jgi:hypothetical protein
MMLGTDAAEEVAVGTWALAAFGVWGICTSVGIVDSYECIMRLSQHSLVEIPYRLTECNWKVKSRQINVQK